MIHGLPVDAQKTNADAYKVLNDFLDTAGKFVESPAARPSPETGTPPTTAPDVYDMKFYVPKLSSSTTAVEAEPVAGWLEDAVEPSTTSMVRVRLPVPRRHRTLNTATAAAPEQTHAWESLVRKCLKKLLDSIDTPTESLPSWIVKEAPPPNARSGRPKGMSRKEIHRAVMKELRKPSGRGDAEQELATVSAFDIAQFPESVQQFLLRHVVIGSAGVGLSENVAHKVAAPVGAAVQRLASALSHNAEELGLDVADIKEPGMSRRDDFLRGGITIQVVTRAAHDAARKKQPKKLKSLGATGVRLKARSAEITVAEDFDEDAFIDVLVRAQEFVSDQRF